jgi:hypothetical protein
MTPFLELPFRKLDKKFQYRGDALASDEKINKKLQDPGFAPRPENLKSICNKISIFSIEYLSANQIIIALAAWHGGHGVRSSPA